MISSTLQRRGAHFCANLLAEEFPQPVAQPVHSEIYRAQELTREKSWTQILAGSNKSEGKEL